MRDHPEATSPRSAACSEVLSALPLYVGQDLDSAELDKVALHLDGCESCAAQHGRALDARAALTAGDWITADPATGDPSIGDPSTGDPSTGDPSIGDPSIGDPSIGDSGGPSLWEGVRAGMLAEGLLGARPRLVSSPSPFGASRPTAEPLVHRSRWWIGSSAAAAALLFAFGLSGLLGSDGSFGRGFEGSAVDVEGTHRTVAGDEAGSARLIPTTTDAWVPGHLRRPAADREPLLHDAVEWLPEQGIYVPVSPPAKPSLVEGPRRLRPVQK